MIHVDHLNVVRDGKTICTVPSLHLGGGARLGVLGGNGSGKTTLLRVLAGLERDYRGTCHVRLEQNRRVLVQQGPYLFRGTVMENVTYGLRARRVARKARSRIALEWLARLGIGHLAARQVSRLSAGERRRTALARALAIQPDLLLLDEPFGDLDAAGIETVRNVLHDLDGMSMVLTSPTDFPPGAATHLLRLSHRAVDSRRCTDRSIST